MQEKIALNCLKLQGSGPPIMLLHGWKQSILALKPLGELLSPVATPYLIDLPGFGDSPAPDSAWSVYEYAECLYDYLHNHNIHSIDLLGHSFGGKIALCLAARYPLTVRKLVLMAPSALRPKHSFADQMRLEAIKMLGKSLKVLDSAFGSTYFDASFAPRFGSKDYLEAGNLRDILVKTVNSDLSDEAAAVQAHTLILWGDRDRHTPVEGAYRLHELIRKSELKIFPGKGHQIFEGVGAHLCAYKIRSFLNLKKEGQANV